MVPVNNEVSTPSLPPRSVASTFFVVCLWAGNPAYLTSTPLLASKSTIRWHDTARFELCATSQDRILLVFVSFLPSARIIAFACHHLSLSIRSPILLCGQFGIVFLIFIGRLVDMAFITLLLFPVEQVVLLRLHGHPWCTPALAWILLSVPVLIAFASCLFAICCWAGWLIAVFNLSSPFRRWVFQ